MYMTVLIKEINQNMVRFFHLLFFNISFNIISLLKFNFILCFLLYFGLLKLMFNNFHFF